MKDAEFKHANRVFSGNLVVQKSKGLDKSSTHRPISPEHLVQIFDNYLVPPWDNDLKCLQLKVYFDITYYLGKWGVEGLREMEKDSFVFKTNSDNREYMQLSYNERTKKSDGTDSKEMNEQQIILSQPKFPEEFYLSKLTPIDAPFKQPNPNFKKTTDVWYTKISLWHQYNRKLHVRYAAGLSYIKKNHCTRGTTASCMKRAGYTLEEIAFVLKHKKMESLKHYLATPSM